MSRITQAQPALEFIQPQYQPWVRQLGRSLVKFWLKWQKGITRTEVTNPDVLVNLYQQFQAGDIRFLLAFRHPTTIDPLVISHTVWNCIPAAARQQQMPLKQPPHVHFVYDRGIPLWAGPFVAWVISRLGGTPIRRGSLDTIGLRSIRQLFANGPFPMAAAPEGGINGHNEIVSPIEPGIAQFGFWCVDDLRKANRDETVLIVPIGIQYMYESAPWKSVADLLLQLEVDSGLRSPDTPISQHLATLQDGQPPTKPQEEELYQRLYGLGEHLLSKMEDFYCMYYNVCREDLCSSSEGDGETSGSDLDKHSEANALGERLHNLLSMALKVAEQAFGIRKPKGSLTDRCRRVEQAAWDRIYRTEVNHSSSLNMLDRGLVDLVAEEANLRLWHMHLVETFVSVTGKYVAERPTIERFADTALLIWKMMQQIGHTSASDFPKLGPRSAKVTVGEPINVSERWDEYQAKRRVAIAQVTQNLQSALEKLIDYSDRD
jgi:1-acyl-sn-glycerol-3-phosphate acyltransferase